MIDDLAGVEMPAFGVLGHHQIALGDHVRTVEVFVARQRFEADLQACYDPIGTGAARARSTDVGVVGVVGQQALHAVPVTGGERLPVLVDNALVLFGAHSPAAFAKVRSSRSMSGPLGA